MAATILESLSHRKLLGVMSVMLAIQIISFYIGAFLTPSPSSIEQFTSVHCHRKDKDQFAIPRFSHGVSKNCESTNPTTTFDTTTFAAQLPLPRDGIVDLSYSRWMQTLLVLLTPDFEYDQLLASSLLSDSQQQVTSNKPGTSPKKLKQVKFDQQFPLLIDVDLAVKNKGDKDWRIYAQRKGIRRTIVFKDHISTSSHKLDCDPIQLFELQSLHYDFYLINFEIREDKSFNRTLMFPGKLLEITGVAIHHNGGFIQIWLMLKTTFFAMTLGTLIWYCKRLAKLGRKTILIERILVGLGAALTQLNAPIEFLTLRFDIPFMMFLNDIRQGFFYCVLLSFWVIFVGEHLLDGTRKNNKLANYVKELCAISIASLALLIFDSSERGMQAYDPFLTVWESEPNVANLFITIASCACMAYLGFLLYYIYLAFNTISGRQNSLPKMQITKRLKYQGMIYRFKFLLFATTICAVSTVVFYAFSHHRNDRAYDDDSLNSVPTIEWTSAMLTSVCAMWNLYVIFLMILYAPSYKGTNGGTDMSDHVEFDCLTDDKMDDYTEGDMTMLQDLTTKASFD